MCVCVCEMCPWVVLDTDCSPLFDIVTSETKTEEPLYVWRCLVWAVGVNIVPSPDFNELP